MWSSANWISVIVAIVGVAGAWGAMQTKIANLKEQIGDLKAQLGELKGGRERTGDRLGKLEQDVRLLRYITGRHETSALPQQRNLTPNPEET